jgi:hypothetical protein
MCEPVSLLFGEYQGDFQKNSEPAAENSKNACSTGISRTSRQFDIREEQGAPNCPYTERALANWEAGIRHSAGEGPGRLIKAPNRRPIALRRRLS